MQAPLHGIAAVSGAFACEEVEHGAGEGRAGPGGAYGARAWLRVWGARAWRRVWGLAPRRLYASCASVRSQAW